LKSDGNGSLEGGRVRATVFRCRDGADDESANVLLKAMAKKISWLAAAEIIGQSHLGRKNQP
jgi:hypothetical protein